MCVTAHSANYGGKRSQDRVSGEARHSSAPWQIMHGPQYMNMQLSAAKTHR